jgi:putative Holliday junction resolvase
VTAVHPGVRIGVDVGSARVGVAASDPAGTFALPVATLPRDLAHGSDLDQLVTLATERQAVAIVVGLPLLLSGEEGAAAQISRSYAAELAKRVRPVPVRLVDERLTTVDAHRRLRDSGVPGRGQRAVVDQAAATLILQVALDAESQSGEPAGEMVSSARKPRRKAPPR